MSSSVHFVSTSCCDTSINSENLNSQSIDPLQKVGKDIQHEYVRIDSVVFAEPLAYSVVKCNSSKDAVHVGEQQDSVITIDNVLVQKRTNKKYKKYHINFEDSSDLSCPQSNCNRKFSNTKLLKAHIRKVHCAEHRYICEVCGVTFTCRYLLVRHAVVHGRRVQCSVCDMVLSARTGLSAHLRTHSGFKPHTCTICKKQFTRKSTLDTHVKFVHREDQIQCQKCPDRFSTRSQWTRHMSTHRGTGK